MQQDRIADQLRFKEFVDPVTGWQGNQGIRKSPLRDLPREMNAVGRPIFGPLRDFASIMSF